MKIEVWFLLSLENRISDRKLSGTNDNYDLYCSVALARLLFPVESEIVQDIAKLDETCEFTASSLEPDHRIGEKRTSLDLNMAPFQIHEKHLSRLRALCKTGMD